MEDLSKYDGPSRVITSFDKMDELHAKNQFKPTVHFKFGIDVLDNVTSGMKGGDLILIAGDEGEGKTTLLRTTINNVADQEKRCLFFSCEERPDEILRKFGDKVPYFLWPNEIEETTLTWMNERLQEAKQKYGDVHLIAIDHLLYVEDGYRSGSQEQDIWRHCRSLKRWAQIENLSVAIVHHTNRTESKEEPSQRSLYGSGGPGKESDTCIYVWRHDDANTATLKVTKCRETGAKNVKVYVEKRGPFLYSYTGFPKEKPIRQMHAEKLARRGMKDD